MARYAIIEGGKVSNIIEADAEFAASIGAVLAAADAAIGDGYEGGQFLKLPPPAPSRDEVIKRYDAIVQGRLDSVARSFGYGDPNRPEVSPILHAITYADEPAVPKYQQEGQALRAWRSLTWAKAAEILSAVDAGQRAVPTEAELLAELEAAAPAPTQAPLPA